MEKKINEVLEKYGLTPFDETELKILLKSIGKYKEKEGEKISVEKIMKVLFSSTMNVFDPSYLKDEEKISEFLLQEKKVNAEKWEDLKKWHLNLIHLDCLERSLNHSCVGENLFFGYYDSEIFKTIRTDFIKNIDFMKEEFPYESIQIVFEEKEAIMSVYKKIVEDLKGYCCLLNGSSYLAKLRGELILVIENELKQVI